MINQLGIKRNIKKTNKIVFIYKSSLLKRSVLKGFDKNFRVD